MVSVEVLTAKTRSLISTTGSKTESTSGSSTLDIFKAERIVSASVGNVIKIEHMSGLSRSTRQLV